MSIHKILLGSTILLSFAIILIAVLLVVFTTKMNSMTDELGDSVESVRASEEIQLGLLLHYQQSTDKEIEKNLSELIEIAKNHINTSDEGVLVEQLDRAVKIYFLEAAQSFETGVQNDLKTVFNEAFRLADLVTESNIEHALEIKERSIAANRLAALIATLFCVFSMISLIAFWLAMRFWIYRPVQHICQMIRNFSESGRRVKPQFKGPMELKEIADSFVDLSSSLDQKRKEQLRFLASVAHDLRNPLSAIRMSGEVLAEAHDAASNEQKPLVEIINRQVELLNRMVGDLLDATRIESGDLELRLNQEDLNQLIEDAVVLHRPLSSVHQIEVQLPGQSVYCHCDRLRISQVLNNLLSNAIKYSPNGGLIRLELENSGNFATIKVSDPGIGIQKEDRDKIFLPFHRTQTTKETIPGVGLGLSVTKKIIESHHGFIGIESELGKGSTFLVRLPVWNRSSQFIRAM